MNNVTTNPTNEIQVTQTVYYHGKKCIVTNLIGRHIQISPVGNGDSPAQYYQVKPEDITTTKIL